MVTASGGARMQEGVLALMQMAKTVVGFELMHDAELPVIMVLAHPTTGGVWASFASLGDVTYAEPGALIAFSGPRVIEQTTREKLSEEFGRAETQLANGQVDAVVDRRELAGRIGQGAGHPPPPVGARPAAGGHLGAGRRRSRGRRGQGPRPTSRAAWSRRSAGRTTTRSDADERRRAVAGAASCGGSRTG